MIGLQFDPGEWGTVADWLTFVATALYLGVTYGLLRIALRSYRESKAATADTERRKQADLVACWYTGIVERRVEDGRNKGMVMRLGAGLVRNASTLPVYEVQVMVAKDWPETGRWKDHAGWLVGAHAYGARVLGPDETMAFTFTAPTGPIDPALQLTFTDAGQRHWMRDPYGILEETETNQFDNKELLRDVELRDFDEPQGV